MKECRVCRRLQWLSVCSAVTGQHAVGSPGLRAAAAGWTDHPQTSGEDQQRQGEQARRRSPRNAQETRTSAHHRRIYHLFDYHCSVAEWLACWTPAQKGLGSNRSRSLRQTVHTHRASVHQAAKLVTALLRVARVTAGLAESNGSLPPGLWLTSSAGWLPRTGISSGTVAW